MRVILRWILRVLLVLMLLLLLVIVVWYYVLWPADRSLLTWEPCAPPCWQNLTPGLSTEQDVMHYISNLPKMEQSRLTTYSHYSERCGVVQAYRWTGGRNGAFREIVVREGRVRLIEVAPDYNLRLGAVVDRFGPPEYMSADLGLGDDGSIYIIEVYYPQQGLTFELRPKVQDAGEIRPDMSIRTVSYSMPGDDLLSYLLNWSSGCSQWEDIQKAVEAKMRFSIQRWQGFGKIEVAISGLGKREKVKDAILE